MDNLSNNRPQAVRTREPGLDLLRSIAIILVVGFHMQPKGTPRFLRPVEDLGWVGVDLFFVLSGYLIRSQLLRPYARSEGFSVRIFFLSRAFRILPAFLVLLSL